MLQSDVQFMSFYRLNYKISYNLLHNLVSRDDVPLYNLPNKNTEQYDKGSLNNAPQKFMSILHNKGILFPHCPSTFLQYSGTHQY